MKNKILFTFSFLIVSIFSFSQNTKISGSPTITGYYSEEGIIVGGRHPVVYANRIVMQKNGNKVRGYYGWAAQGESEYFFEGQIVGNKIIGKKYSFSNLSIDSSAINITILNNALSLKNEIDNPILKLRLKPDYLNKQVDIYTKPDIRSALIKGNFSLYNKGFVIVEIGEMSHTGDEYRPYNIWYKVKNNLIEGWVHGLVSVF